MMVSICFILLFFKIVCFHAQVKSQDSRAKHSSSDRPCLQKSPAASSCREETGSWVLPPCPQNPLNSQVIRKRGKYI